MAESKKVFISYSSRDRTLANTLVDYLESKDGIQCFIAPRDIAPGKDYALTIMTGIESCDTMVVILSEAANDSHHVRNEIDSAFNRDKTIIIFRVENIYLSKTLEYYAATFQWLDAFEYSSKIYFEQLHNYLLGLPIPPLPKKLIRGRKILLYGLVSYFSATILLLIFFGIPIYRDYSKVNIKNTRKVKFVDAIATAGLTDIENKGVLTAPNEIYEKAEKEIFVSGITLLTTLENYGVYINDALKRGVKIKFLLLAPESPDSVVVKYINNRMQSFDKSIGSALIKIDSSYIHPNIEIRLMPVLPPVIGIAIDANIGNPADSSLSPSTLVRANISYRSPEHHEWIWVFKPNGNKPSVYNDIAKEFRHTWQRARIYKSPG
jgi:hypothetical protein